MKNRDHLIIALLHRYSKRIKHTNQRKMLVLKETGIFFRFIGTAGGAARPIRCLF